MDAANKALCYYYRHPPDASKPMAYSEICKLVRRTDGEHPSVGGVFEAVQTFHQKKKPAGRKRGWRKTTKQEDKVVLQTFHKCRPPGYGVDSRTVHTKLPTKVRLSLHIYALLCLAMSSPIDFLASRSCHPRLSYHPLFLCILLLILLYVWV